MSFAAFPLELEPVRTNVLRVPQINQEIHNLEKNIETLEASIKQIQQEHKPKEPTQTPHEPQPTLNKTRTSDVYRTKGPLPKRFEEPDTWNYKVKKQHPMFSTTANSYGSQPPTIHDMPTTFLGQSTKFSEQLDHAGPYRNFSLNI
ncbi:hypothetical protein HDV01_001681 [Terramyces sp. JEL0728]|nr:hypothetical protein HDV01_003071 [Terramyces sp. JEL0728]KAJ3269202.1 hypothetical protein HDV01_001681 [Terramyces sp. JEL0728]